MLYNYNACIVNDAKVVCIYNISGVYILLHKYYKKVFRKCIQL
jgi:hypothetical protein